MRFKDIRPNHTEGVIEKANQCITYYIDILLNIILLKKQKSPELIMTF